MELARPNEESWRMRRRRDEGVEVRVCGCLVVRRLLPGLVVASGFCWLSWLVELLRDGLICLGGVRAGR